MIIAAACYKLFFFFFGGVGWICWIGWVIVEKGADKFIKNYVNIGMGICVFVFGADVEMALIALPNQ